MIEELCEYFVRKGWHQDIADDVHNAYYDEGMEGVKKIASKIGDPSQHDYRDEISEAVVAWQKEVGEYR